MRYVIIGAGQIGTQLAGDLVRAGHDVTVVRRSATASATSISTIAADVIDVDAWAPAAEGAAAIFHCMHAPYDSRVWARDLPPREQAVMDVAVRYSIPVIFPESMYAFGTHAHDLHEGAPPAPISPLGEVRADLLRARAAHPAATLSVVGSDLIGPSASAGSVAALTVVGPLAAGRRAWLLGAPDAPHSWTSIPDLSRAMIHCAVHADRLAPAGDAVLHCPTAAPRSLRELAEDTAQILGRPARTATVPRAALHLARPFHPMLRELDRQQYLWREPCVLQPGRLILEGELSPTPWEDALRAMVTRVDA